MAALWQGHSNLQCFLDCTTPTVKTQIFPKTGLWETPDSNLVKWFRLVDLWAQYYEWSAYGAGTNVQLSNGENVVQYYVPYLSAIQLYTVAHRFNGGTGVYYRRDQCENDKLFKDSGFNNEDAWGSRRKLGELCFEFSEVCSPYGRVPLLDKVYELSHNFPGLVSLTSLELSPASWMAVAWYPIYHIPTRCNVKELSACFLTYHTISSTFQDDMPDMKEETVCSNTKCNNRFRKISDQKMNSISLPPFGLATYKVQGNLWMNPETGDKEKAASLYRAADSWLKQLGVHHHDFNYFRAHSL